MEILIGAAALAALLLWLLLPSRRRRIPAPEDDVTTPIDHDELAEAERELASADDPSALDDDEHDDWGPGRA